MNTLLMMKYSFTICLFLRLELIVCKYQQSVFPPFPAFSAYTCKGHDRWLVQYNDTAESEQIFQDWLYYRQNDCLNKTLEHSPAPINGIGSSIQWSMRSLVIAIEQGMAYRPNGKQVRPRVPGPWIWADESAQNCTLGIRAVDCYFKPLSICSFENHNDSISSLDMQKVRRGQLNGFKPKLWDTCTIAKDLRKPIQWVHAQYTNYFLRYSEDMAASIDSKILQVFGRIRRKNRSHRNDYNSSTIAVHVRGGDPYKYDKRQIANISFYMDAVDYFVKKLQRLGRPVETVYLCSHTQDKNIVSAAHMAALYPGNYTYKVLPHTTYGEGSELDAELLNKTQVKLKKPPLRQLVLEYLADLEIMADADVFIGSHSSVYPIATALRIARYGEHFQGEQNCFLDIRHGPVPPLVCEKEIEISKCCKEEIWQDFLGGFNGGSVFWTPTER